MLHQLQVPFSNTLTYEDKTYLYFAGTAYLGIPKNEEVKLLLQEGLNLYGLNNGTSRSNSIQLGIYNEVEAIAANYFAAPDSLITSSGYLAAQLAVRNLSPGKTVIYAPDTHPALWINGKPEVTGSFSTWKEACLQQIHQSEETEWLIISNALNNLEPELYDFSFLNAVAPAKNITLLVDDSHGIGVLNEGKGIFKSLVQQNHVQAVSVASMAKALGIDAGIILGSTKLIAQLKRSNEFLGASPPSAASLYAFSKALDFYQSAYKVLMERCNYFASHLAEAWRYAPGFPVFYIDEKTFAHQLQQSKILISSFPYPSPESPALNRIVLCSWHTKADIDKLIETIKRAYPQLIL